MSPTDNDQRDLEQRLLTMAQMIAEAHIRSDERAKAAHERFNVFTTLLDETDEVRLHTRFIHCLLDPRGCHDCGSLFLDLLFATLEEMPGLDHRDQPARLDVPVSNRAWEVGKEQSRPPFGQIDVLLERTDFGIAIENKIYAEEQHRQIAGYAEYLKQQHGSSWRLLYLTLDGKRSGEHEGASYVRISYRQHIRAWLEKCLRETYHIIPINQALQQYRKVVCNLTGKTLNETAMKPITDFVLQNPVILKYRQEIQDGINEARANFLDRLAEGVASDLAKRGYTTQLSEQNTGGRFGLGSEGDMLLYPPNPSLVNAPFALCLEHDGNLKKVLVGITTHLDKHRPKAEDESLFKRMDALLGAEAEARSYHKEKANPAWPTGWHDILPADDAALADLIKTPLGDTVAKVCEAVLLHVKLVEQFYKDAKQSGTSPQ